MAVDPSRFHIINVVDTCSVWNVLSSLVLYNASLAAKCVFSCTAFVYYECVHKPRKQILDEDRILIDRLDQQRQKGQFKEYHIDVEDLQEIQVLANRQRISKGELSSMVFAKKTRQAFMTDDQSARYLAEKIMDGRLVQTTPHLFGWLFYSDLLIDSDKDTIIEEHTRLGRPLSPYFEEIYLKAYETKLSHRRTK